MKGLRSGIVTFPVSAYGIVQNEGFRVIGSSIVTIFMSAYGIVVQMKG